MKIFSAAEKSVIKVTGGFKNIRHNRELMYTNSSFLSFHESKRFDRSCGVFDWTVNHPSLRKKVTDFNICKNERNALNPQQQAI